jgi:hypothetical protein
MMECLAGPRASHRLWPQHLGLGRAVVIRGKQKVSNDHAEGERHHRQRQSEPALVDSRAEFYVGFLPRVSVATLSGAGDARCVPGPMERPTVSTVRPGSYWPLVQELAAQ